MAPHTLLWCIFITILHLSQQTFSQQCLVVWVTVDIIEPGLDPTDWEGAYTTDGSATTSGCLSYTTPQGAILEYHTGSWSIRSINNEYISHEMTPSSPCNPPLTTTSWEHGADVNESTITITCSYSSSPTKIPSNNPTYQPSAYPTSSTPTNNPTLEPTQEPTQNPSLFPTQEPTHIPTDTPTFPPTPAPTTNPTSAPTAPPSSAPSFAPVLAPTIAPTQDCSRIILLVKGPQAIIPSHIDGIYYQSDYAWPASGYPWYQQYKSGTENNQQDSNHVSIIFTNYWTIIDVQNDVELQYQQTFTNPTLHVPPHTPIVGDGWTDVSVGAPGNTFWEILIKCTSMTSNPTADPTLEPTEEPTTDPTFEPTHLPTQAQPTFLPTVEPIASTARENASAEVDTFLDTFNILEWLIIAAVPLICCLIIASLYTWRNRRIQKCKDEDAAHLLSAKVPSVNLIEMTSPKQRKANLDFGRHSKQGTADFANALAVVSKHKSQKSLNESGGYKAVDARSPDDSMIMIPPPVPASPGQTQTESEFYYGNHPMDEIYSHEFITKPFGMEWKTTKTDKKNLYVSKIQQGSQASIGNVRVGSKLLSFNGEMIENLGAKQIYGKLAISDMPLTITFLKPFRKEQDKEGDNYQSGPPPLPQLVPPAAPKTPPVVPPQLVPLVPPQTPPPIPQLPLVPPKTPPAVPPQTPPAVPPQTPPAVPPQTPPSFPPPASHNNRPLTPPKVPSLEYDALIDEDDPFAEIGPPPLQIPVMDHVD